MTQHQLEELSEGCILDVHLFAAFPTHLPFNFDSVFSHVIALRKEAQAERQRKSMPQKGGAASQPEPLKKLKTEMPVSKQKDMQPNQGIVHTTSKSKASILSFFGKKA